ncbi:hypothetical protein F2Q69_00016728 [Brassica cretica]|uniref:Uncharacterized protein n=1 Tax=Brassica cretica TaxID=69181 RepID=A0A8S9QQ89_BRACR|nr:hypothetical protein F2Q69_00016728 [Brassica cretica]
MGATAPERHREVAVTPLQSDLTRATPRCRSRGNNENAPGATSRSDPSGSLPKPGATLPQRRGEVARVFIPRSDLTTATRRSRSRLHPPERPYHSDAEKSLASSSPGVTSRSDLSRSLLKKRPGSDFSQRLLEVAPDLLFPRIHFYSRAFWSFHYALFTLSKPMFKNPL